MSDSVSQRQTWTPTTPAGFTATRFGAMVTVSYVSAGEESHTTNDVIATLPAAYRPPTDLVLPAIITTNATNCSLGKVVVFANGTVKLYGATRGYFRFTATYIAAI